MADNPQTAGVLWWIAGVALFVGGMAVSIGAPADARNARLLAERGVEVPATVTDVRVTRGGRYSRRTAVVDVEFEDEFGVRAESADIRYCGDYRAISVRQTVKITYDPEEVAPAQFTECPGSQAITIPLIIGVAVLALGTAAILWAWLRGGWRRRWIGIPLLILGVLVVGTAFDPSYRELVFTGGALILIAVAALVAPGRRRRAATGSLVAP